MIVLSYLSEGGRNGRGEDTAVQFKEEYSFDVRLPAVSFRTPMGRVLFRYLRIGSGGNGDMVGRGGMQGEQKG
jgi:hypothetical protein